MTDSSLSTTGSETAGISSGTFSMEGAVPVPPTAPQPCRIVVSSTDWTRSSAASRLPVSR